MCGFFETAVKRVSRLNERLTAAGAIDLAISNSALSTIVDRGLDVLGVLDLLESVMGRESGAG